MRAPRAQPVSVGPDSSRTTSMLPAEAPAAVEIALRVRKRRRSARIAVQRKNLNRTLPALSRQDTAVDSSSAPSSPTASRMDRFEGRPRCQLDGRATVSLGAVGAALCCIEVMLHLFQTAGDRTRQARGHRGCVAYRPAASGKS